MILVSKKTKFILTRFGLTFETFRFNEKSFHFTSLDFTPFSVHMPTIAIHAEFPVVYTSEKIMKLSTVGKKHILSNVTDGSAVTGFRQTILFSFVLDKLPGQKLFYQLELLHCNKINKLVLLFITFYLENNNHEEVNFIGKTLTFT